MDFVLKHKSFKIFFNNHLHIYLFVFENNSKELYKEKTKTHKPYC